MRVTQNTYFTNTNCCCNNYENNSRLHNARSKIFQLNDNNQGKWNNIENEQYSIYWYHVSISDYLYQSTKLKPKKPHIKQISVEWCLLKSGG